MPSSSTYSSFNPTSTSVLRTADDEATDQDELIKNIASGTYKSWPNEAGFEGLTEEKGPIRLHLQGDIPRWAVGSLFRTGPSGREVVGTPHGTHYVSHWFDGFAQTHKFDILPPAEGDAEDHHDASSSSTTSGKVRVVYSSRRQADDMIRYIQANGASRIYTFAQRRDPCIGLFGKLMSVFQKSPEVTNVSVVVNTNVPGLSPAASSGHREGVRNVWISTDSSEMVEADTDTLEPIGVARQNKLHPDLKGRGSCAHAQRDPATGDLFNWNLEFGKAATYRIFRVNAKTGTTDILATVSDPAVKAAYIHSFFLTASYVVLCIPISHYLYGGATIPWNHNLLDSIEPFDESELCKWLVIDRRGDKGLVATFESRASFFFHSVNSFEKPVPTGETDLFLDLVEYENQDNMRGYYYDILLNREGAAEAFLAEGNRTRTIQPKLNRYRLRIQPSASPPSSSSPPGAKDGPLRAELVSSIPSPHAGELPNINPNYQCKRHRFVYGVATTGRSTLFDSLVKTDVDTRQALLWRGPHGHTPGEPIFVPRPAAGDGEDAAAPAEDDGVLLSVVLDGAAERSYLLCLDAKTMDELGRAECGFAVGIGFHGTHAPSGNL